MLGRGTRTAAGKINALVLYFACNVARHGLLADVQPPRERRPGQPAACAAPLKVCPLATPMPPVSARLLRLRAQICAAAPSIRFIRIPGGRCTGHQKPGKPPVLRVGYEIEGGRWINEWLPIESKHRVAQIRARQWWRQRAELPLPHSVADALRLTSFLRAPVEISLVRDGDFARVAAARFGEPVS